VERDCDGGGTAKPITALLDGRREVRSYVVRH
jgi:hypothetical protein